MKIGVSCDHSGCNSLRALALEDAARRLKFGTNFVSVVCQDFVIIKRYWIEQYLVAAA